MANVPVTWLDEFVANLTTGGIQSDPDIVQLANGNILIAWTSTNDTGVGSNSGTDIIAQIFDPLGNPLDDEFALNTSYFADDERDADIVALADGGFIFTFVDDEGANGTSLRMEHYDSTGTRVNSASIASDSDANLPAYDGAHVAVSSATSVMFVYRELGVGSAGNGDIYFRLYNPSTETLGAATLCLQDGSNEVLAPDITVLANGNYAIVAEVANSGRLVTRVLDATGVNVDGADFVDDTGGAGVTDSAASITALSGGGMAITFTRTTVSGDEVYVTILDNAADQVLAPTRVSASGDTAGGALTLGLRDGSFIVAYSNATDGQLIAAHYSAGGTYLGQTVVGTISGIKSLSGVAMGDGRFTLTWQTSNDIHTEILDTRDVVGSPAYTPDGWQVGTIGNDSFSATATIVHGYDGNDTINDGGGNSTVYGDAGNDEINMNAVSSLESLDGGSGIDTLRATTIADGTIYDLAAGNVTSGPEVEIAVNFERIIGTASDEFMYGSIAANRLTGGLGVDLLDGRGGADTLLGGGGVDTLIGGGGKDKMTGGGGGDFFVFASAVVAANADTITDFKHNVDTIQLDNAVFTGLGLATGALGGAKFWAGASAHDANDRIIYNSANGNLYYDADGTGATAQVLFAKLDTGLTISSGDFEVI